MIRTVLLCLALAAQPAAANDLLPAIRFSTHDAGADGSADSFNPAPSEGLMQRDLTGPVVRDDRAMQEFDVSGFPWQSIAVATISGTVAAVDTTNSGIRSFTFRLYAGNGAADLSDHSVPAGVFGSGSYWPPAESSFTYSFDVTHQVTTLMLGGATWIGLRVECTSNWSKASSLALATNTRLRILLHNGTGFCFGDGSGSACPCGNHSAPGAEQGCQNSLGVGAQLRGGGTASISNDEFTLRGALLPDSFALFFQGTSTVGGGIGAPFGDGLRCAGGTVTRLATKAIAGGIVQFPAVGEPPISVRGQVSPGGGLRHYQIWYRNPAGFCTADTFNLSNGWSVTWTV